jgi:hypothetical protein
MSGKQHYADNRKNNKKKGSPTRFSSTRKSDQEDPILYTSISTPVVRVNTILSRHTVTSSTMVHQPSSLNSSPLAL